MNTANIMTLTCPHCFCSNRVPSSRLSDSPKCGRCHELVFTGKPVQLDGNSATRFLQNNDTPLMIDFWAAWCGPCQQMGPFFEAAAAQLEPEFRLCKLDTENVPEIASRFAIRSIPTLIIVHHGQEVIRTSGVMSTADIVAWGRQALASR